ncbi:hypothetical protein [Lactiplantibacillus fabifermentans]|uniref:Secreted protein n=2 Tax=Lactiplantibacillus fabifermentans TaxID=483011 RepID=A0A0R2NPK6_9LACO|nr:hypothetical protein [Lactiplantibacillus fabifermentans]ETY74885.1 hypothetical protein LFAB_05130 [Lactiplantibacillus fabifermentans T30PCM01]KRO27649.1 hypothetical protein DY78_GL003067 [Lactiplantibacillus fabifermentans DSM 21115]
MKKHRLVLLALAVTLSGSLLATPDLTAQAMRVRTHGTSRFFRFNAKKRTSHHAKKAHHNTNRHRR